MKKLFTSIFILFIALASVAQNNAETEIINILLSEQNQYETCRKNRFKNNDLLREITLLKKTESDSVQLEGIYINYAESIKTLKKRNKKRIKKLKRCKDEHHMTFSHPILSIDKKSAFVFMTTECGIKCGIGELWIFKIENGKSQKRSSDMNRKLLATTTCIIHC